MNAFGMHYELTYNQLNAMHTMDEIRKNNIAVEKIGSFLEPFPLDPFGLCPVNNGNVLYFIDPNMMMAYNDNTNGDYMENFGYSIVGKNRAKCLDLNCEYILSSSKQYDFIRSLLLHKFNYHDSERLSRIKSIIEEHYNNKNKKYIHCTKKECKTSFKLENEGSQTNINSTSIKLISHLCSQQHNQLLWNKIKNALAYKKSSKPY